MGLLLINGQLHPGRSGPRVLGAFFASIARKYKVRFVTPLWQVAGTLSTPQIYTFLPLTPLCYFIICSDPSLDVLSCCLAYIFVGYLESLGERGRAEINLMEMCRLS